MKVYIEFKESLSKSIKCKEIKANDLEEARKLFKTQHPNGEIIKIEGRN